MYTSAPAVTAPMVPMVGFNIFAVAKKEVAPLEVWPENWQAFRLFNSLHSQWRVGMGGATGLDYAALYPLMDRMELEPDDWQLLFDDIQIMEGAALEAMSEKT